MWLEAADLWLLPCDQQQIPMTASMWPAPEAYDCFHVTGSSRRGLWLLPCDWQHRPMTASIWRAAAGLWLLPCDWQQRPMTASMWPAAEAYDCFHVTSSRGLWLLPCDWQQQTYDCFHVNGNRGLWLLPCDRQQRPDCFHVTGSRGLWLLPCDWKQQIPMTTSMWPAAAEAYDCFHVTGSRGLWLLPCDWQQRPMTASIWLAAEPYDCFHVAGSRCLWLLLWLLLTCIWDISEMFDDISKVLVILSFNLKTYPLLGGCMMTWMYHLCMLIDPYKLAPIRWSIENEWSMDHSNGASCILTYRFIDGWISGLIGGKMDIHYNGWIGACKDRQMNR